LENKKIHIISFDVPYPPDYGGVIDVFYKLKALHKQGWQIHLHCFEYGRKQQSVLENYCVKVSYYERKNAVMSLLQQKPYIISSRENKELLNNLLHDDAPILMEGLHCTAFLNHPQLKNRKLIVRTHNIEHEYYGELSKAATNPFKKLFFAIEKYKLKKYESILRYASAIASISIADSIYFQKQFGEKVFYLPAFHPYELVESKTGIGSYILFHGNLSVPENEKVAIYLIDEIFSDLNLPFVIAGKNPSKKLKRMVQHYQHISIVENPQSNEMEELIANAQVHVLPTFQSTGIKLKLINALYSGRHVVINDIQASNNPLAKLCVVSTSSQEMKKIIAALYIKAFTENDIQKRSLILAEEFSNKINIEKLEARIAMN
jgi:hypothetical protein